MDRFYANSEKPTVVKFFYGKEIEKTKFFGLNTLFIVGNQATIEIIETIKSVADKGEKVEHLYFAANHSYNVFDRFEQFQHFLDNGYKITYETTSDRLTDQLLNKLPRNDNFLLMVSVVIADINKFQENIAIKIDDRDTNRKNPGVWCIPLTEITNRKDILTTWEEYKGDTIL